MAEFRGTSYARAVREWEPLDWWRLEARALHHLPSVRRSLAAFAPPGAWRDLPKDAAPAWGCL
ncbi:hypothetical protein [Microbacterium oleivorans]|uniref:Uncharacterized protein n=1 Tax=Microbacterium oleivorans TaxID=273677 RepID=A0A4R5YBL2_9MICO|nr:hypothetical protein [Microbacterium oleivorans]TDL42211.1 hypothetical protein E2R54_14645 [Microbacterium oleivorans]